MVSPEARTVEVTLDPLARRGSCTQTGKRPWRAYTVAQRPQTEYSAPMSFRDRSACESSRPGSGPGSKESRRKGSLWRPPRKC